MCRYANISSPLYQAVMNETYCVLLSQISPSMFGCFLAQIEIDYGNHGNPYHNATHGADVAQTVHYFISQTGLKVGLD